MGRVDEIVNDWCLDISKSLGLPVITGQKSARKFDKGHVMVDGYIPKFPRCIIEFTPLSSRMLIRQFKRMIELKKIYNVEYAFLISISKQNSGDEEQKLWESWVGKYPSNIKNALRFYNCDLEKREAIADLTNFIRSDQGIIHRKIAVSEFNIGNMGFQRKPIQEVIEKMKDSIREFDFEWPPTFNHASVMFNENGKFDIIDGQMRVLAMKDLGLDGKKIPVIIVQNLENTINLFQSINNKGVKLTGIDRLKISLYKLKDGTNPQYFKDIDNEFTRFQDEYKEGHYTSCCLRLGRLIECITASTSEELDIRMKQYNVKNLENLMKEILNETRIYVPNSTLIDKKEEIRYLLSNLNKKYDDFLDDDADTREEAIDWSPRIFLKQIQRNYKSNEKIREKFEGKKTIKSDLEKVWSLRTKASHFRKGEEISELSKKDVDDMLIHLYGFCDKLHEIIIEARK